jgi:predicted phage tail protein
MNRKLILQGSAGEALGEEWSVNAPTVGEAFAIIRANKPKEFLDYFSKDDAQGEFSIKLAGEALETAELALHNLGEGDIVVTPMPKGSKLNAVEKIVVAIALMVYAYYSGDYATAAEGMGTMSTMGSIAFSMGINMMMAGITELMMKEPSKDKDEEGAMFGGPANTVKNGVPVPLAYGKILVGGTPINFGFGAWKLEPTNGFVFASDNPKAWDGEIYDAAGNVAVDYGSTVTGSGPAGVGGGPGDSNASATPPNAAR